MMFWGVNTGSSKAFTQEMKVATAIVRAEKALENIKNDEDVWSCEG